MIQDIDFVIVIFLIVLIAYVFFGTGRPVNLVILTLYIIGVIYVFYRMKESLADEITITFEKNTLNEKLADRNLQDVVGIDFKFADTYEIDKLQELAISIQNKSASEAISVNWDNSCLTGYDGRSRRVIRLTPNMSRDLAQQQVNSVIAPGKTLKEKLTAEDVLQRDTEAGSLKLGGPLVSLAQLEKGSKSEKTLYNGFMSRNISLQFYLQLVLHKFDPDINAERHYIVDCPFTVNKLPWTNAFFWNQKKKDND